jgi:hypothetical protein
MPKNRPLDAPKRHVERIKKAVKKRPKAWRMSQEKLSWHAFREHPLKRTRWESQRSYTKHYNPYFGPALARFLGKRPSTSLADCIASLQKGSSPIRILDDGAGKGLALASLKKKLSQKGVQTETTALTFESDPGLEARQRKGRIDRLVKGRAEFFMPKKPFDLILSLYGSLWYSPRFVAKDHLLKFATSLEKGGILMVGISPIFNFKSTAMLRDNPEKVVQGIVRALEKRGFKARVFERPETVFKENLPHQILVVQRN